MGPESPAAPSRLPAHGTAAVVAELDKRLQNDLDPSDTLAQVEGGLADVLAGDDATPNDRNYLLSRAIPKLLLTVLRRNPEFDGRLAARSQAVLERAASLCASTTALEHNDVRETLARLFSDSSYAKPSSPSSTWNPRQSPASLQRNSVSSSALLSAQTTVRRHGKARHLASPRSNSAPPHSDDGSVSSVAVEESGDLDDFDADDSLAFGNTNNHSSSNNGDDNDFAPDDPHRGGNPVRIMADTKILSAGDHMEQDNSPTATCILTGDPDRDDLGTHWDADDDPQPGALNAVVASFASAGGFDTILNLLNQPTPPSVTYMRSLLRPVHRVRNIQFLPNRKSSEYIASLKQTVYNNLLGMSDNDLKAQDKRALKELMRFLLELSESEQAARPSSPDNPLNPHGLFELEFALKRLKSRFLEQRLAGVTELKYHVTEAHWHESASIQQPALSLAPPATSSSKLHVQVSPDPSDDGSSADARLGPLRRTVEQQQQLRHWLRDNKIIELLFDADRLHPEVLKRTGDLLKFMASHTILDSNGIDTIWNTTRGAHESVKSVVYGLIADLPAELSLQDIEAIWAKISSVPYSEYTQMEITLVANFTMNVLQCPCVISALLDCEKARSNQEDNGPVASLPSSSASPLLGNDQPNTGEPSLSGLDNWFGVGTFWDLVQDGVSASHGTFDPSLAMLRDFIVWEPCSARRPAVIRKCIRNIANHRSQPQTLQILRIVLFSYVKNTKSNDQLSAVALLKTLQTDSKLLNIVLDDYAKYHTIANVTRRSLPAETSEQDLNSAFLVPGSRWHHLWNVTERLEFLKGVCVSCLASYLTTDMLHVVWKCSIENGLTQDESKHAFKWFEDLCPALGVFEKTDLVDFIFDLRLAQLQSRNTSLAGLFCFETYLRDVNLRENKIIYQSDMSGLRSLGWPTLSAEVRGNQDVAVLSTEIRGMSKLWEIAMEAADPAVAQCAATCLQSFYHNLSDSLQESLGPRYQEFVHCCFNRLSTNYRNDENSDSLIALRCVSLIRTFTDEFESRGAKHADIHYQKHGLRARGTPLSLTIMPMGQPKFELETHSNECMWRLRERIVGRLATMEPGREKKPDTLRIITQGRELKDDQKTLGEVGIKQSQQIQVTCGQRSVADPTADGDGGSLEGNPDSRLDAAAGEVVSLSKLDVASYPSQLLSESPYFDTLFGLLDGNADVASAVWDLLMRLPTHPPMVETLRHPSAVTTWDVFLDKSASYSLLYYLQIIHSLCSAGDPDGPDQEEGPATWAAAFFASGGLNELVKALSNSLPLSGSNSVSKECVSLGLKILRNCTTDDVAPRQTHSLASQRPHLTRRPRLLENAERAKGLAEKCLALTIELSRTECMGQSSALVWDDAAEEITVNALTLAVAICGLGEGVVSWLVGTSVFQSWITEVLLVCKNDRKRAMAVQAARWILMQDRQGGTGEQYVISILDRVCGREFAEGVHSLEYFEVLLTCALRAAPESGKFDAVLLDKLFRQLVSLIVATSTFETRRSGVPDGVLTGLLMTTGSIVSITDVDTKTRSVLVEDLFENCLFGIPKPGDMVKDALPKCKSRESRKRAFDLILTLAKGADGVVLKDINGRLVRFHERVGNGSGLTAGYPRGGWYYNPLALEKSLCGYVGLKNLGTTCYMNALLQQLFMIPKFRSDVLCAVSAETTGEPQALLSALQRIFGGLLISTKKFCDTREFCSVYTDSDGLKMNTAMQMDVDEFLNALFDKVERAVKGTAGEKLLTKRFGGKLLNQVICQDVEYVSEREESFFVLSLEVKGKNSLQESLDFYVKGELLDGDNKYYCQPHDRHVAALKRTCLGSLPPTLIIHLKRFEFDFDLMRKVKLNDRCEFPSILDLEPYTKDAIMRREKSEEPQNGPPSTGKHIYSLAGILVHSGTAESGHYYSYIKERKGPEAIWLQFNDVHTAAFDETDIPATCFGGSEAVQQFDPIQQKHVQWWQPKQHSAYMLFYDRCDIRSAEGSEMELDVTADTDMKQLIPSEIFDRLWRENEAFALDTHAFESDYGSFLKDLTMPQLSDMTEDGVFSGDSRALQYATMYAIDCLSRTKDFENLHSWKTRLEAVYRTNQIGAEWILNRCVSQPDIWPRNVLLECTAFEARVTLSCLFQSAIECLAARESVLGYTDIGHDQSSMKDDLATIVDDVTTDVPRGVRDDDRFLGSWGGRSRSILGRFIDLLLSFLSRSQHFWNFDQLMLAVFKFATSPSGKERLFLIQRKAILRLVDFYLGDESPMASPQSPPRAKKTKVDERLSFGSMKPLFDLLELLVTTCVTSPGACPSLSPLPEGLSRPVLENMDLEMVSCSALYSAATKDEVNALVVGRLAAHVCWQNLSVSNILVDTIISGLDQVNWEAFRAYFEIFDKVLGLNDVITPARIDYALSKYVKMVYDNRQYKNATTHAIRYLVRLLSGQEALVQHVCRWFINNVDQWMDEWLIQIPFSPVRQEAYALIEATLKACHEHYDEAASIVLYGHVFQLVSPAVGIAQRIRADNKFDQDSFGRFAPLCAALSHCVRQENERRDGRGSKRLLENLERTVTLLHIVNSTDLENDESRLEMYRLFLIAMDVSSASSVELAKDLTSNPVYIKAFMSPHIVEEVEENTMKFNVQFMPIFFETLRLLLEKAPNFIETINQDIVDSCFAHFILRREYRTIHTSLVKAILECIKNESVRRSQIKICLEHLEMSLKPELRAVITVDWILQYLLHLVTQWVAGPVLVAQNGVTILQGCFIEWGADGEAVTSECLREMGLIAAIISKSLASMNDTQMRLTRGEEIVKLSLTVLSRNKVDPLHVIDVFQLCLSYCTHSSAVSRVAGNILIDEYLACAPNSAVSPASESREQLEELSVKDRDSRPSVEVVYAPPYLLADSKVISSVRALILLYIEAHDCEPALETKVGHVLVLLLQYSMAYGEEHCGVVSLILDLVKTSSGHRAELASSLRKHVGVQSYARDVLSKSLPSGDLLSKPSVDLILFICEAQQNYGVIKELVCGGGMPERVIDGLQDCVGAIQAVDMKEECKTPGNVENRTQEAQTKSGIMKVKNAFGALYLGILKGGDVACRVVQIAAGRDVRGVVGPLLPGGSAGLPSEQAQEISDFLARIETLVSPQK